MASLLRGGWNGATPKNALASFGLTVLLFLAPVSPSTAQVEPGDKPKRKVVRTVEPEYSSVMRQFRIRGSVHLNVTVLANGDVASVEAMGGNPILVESATKAVLKWKYAPAASQTKQEVKINFFPD